MRLNIPGAFVEQCEMVVKYMIGEYATKHKSKTPIISITKSRPGYNLICTIGDIVITENKIKREHIREILIDPYSIFIRKIIKTLTGKELN